MNWMDDAACREHTWETFFAEKGRQDQHRAAIMICGGCPVTADCLRHAARIRLEYGQVHGIWAGRTMDKLRLDQARRILGGAA